MGEISAAVAMIYPELAWELGSGTSARHAFTLSSEGDIVLRRLTERWWRRAPRADATWEYFPARQPSPEAVLEIAGQKFDSRDWRFALGVDDGRLVLDLRAYHPVLGRLPQKERPRAGFIASDQIFGEDAVEKWFGRLEFPDKLPPGAGPASEVFETMRRMAEESKKEIFIVAQGHDERRRPLFLSFNQRVKRLDHLFAVNMFQLEVPFLHADSRGLPAPDGNRLLDEFEDRVLEAARGAVYVGRRTGGGRRRWFFYAEDGKAVSDRLTGLVQSDSRWTADVS